MAKRNALHMTVSVTVAALVFLVFWHKAGTDPAESRLPPAVGRSLDVIRPCRLFVILLRICCWHPRVPHPFAAATEFVRCSHSLVFWFGRTRRHGFCQSQRLRRGVYRDFLCLDVVGKVRGWQCCRNPPLDFERMIPVVLRHNGELPWNDALRGADAIVEALQSIVFQLFFWCRSS
jgi:hypothetical protein